MFDRGETSDFELEFLSNLGEGLVKSLYAAGYTFNGERKIQLNAKYVEKSLASTSKLSDDQKEVIFIRFFITLLHEQAHGVTTIGEPYVGKGGKPAFDTQEGKEDGEVGVYFEEMKINLVCKI